MISSFEKNRNYTFTEKKAPISFPPTLRERISKFGVVSFVCLGVYELNESDLFITLKERDAGTSRYIDFCNVAESNHRKNYSFVISKRDFNLFSYENKVKYIQEEFEL